MDTAKTPKTKVAKVAGNPKVKTGKVKEKVEHSKSKATSKKQPDSVVKKQTPTKPADAKKGVTSISISLKTEDSSDAIGVVPSKKQVVSSTRAKPSKTMTVHGTFASNGSLSSEEAQSSHVQATSVQGKTGVFVAKQPLRPSKRMTIDGTFADIEPLTSEKVEGSQAQATLAKGTAGASSATKRGKYVETPKAAVNVTTTPQESEESTSDTKSSILLATDKNQKVANPISKQSLPATQDTIPANFLQTSVNTSTSKMSANQRPAP